MRGRRQVLISNTYFSGQSNSLALHNAEEDIRNSMEDALDDSSSDEDQVVYVGLANGWSKNQTYKN